MTATPGSTATPLAAAGRATVVLTGAALAVQVVGFVRQLFLAAEVGVTSGLDALFIGLTTVLALQGMLTAGVARAILPAYAEATEERGHAAARRLAGTVLVWMGFAGLACSLLLWLFADAIVAITGPGLAQPGTADDAVHYLRILSPMVFVAALSSIIYALLQAEYLFPMLAIAMIAEPTVALAIMLYFWETMGLDGLAIGALAGACVGLSIGAVATIVRHVAPLPHLTSRRTDLVAIVRHAVPLSLSAGILHVNEMVSRAIATLLLAGGVSVLRFGESLVRAPFSAISPAYATAIYPTMVQASRAPGAAELSSMTERVLRYAIVFFVPLAGLTIAVAPLATAIAYDRGEFTNENLMLTAQVVAVSAPLIVTWTVLPTFATALNARRQGAVLLSAGIVNTVMNIALTVVLGYFLGVVGIALAAAIVSAIVVVYMGRRLSALEPQLRLRPAWHTFLKASLSILPSALIVGIPIWVGMIGDDIGQRLAALFLAGTIGLASYYWTARRLGLDEAGSIIDFGKDTLRRVVSRLPVGR